MATLEISGAIGSGKTTLARTPMDSGTPLRPCKGEARMQETEVPPTERYESTDSVVELGRALMDLGYRPIIFGQRVIVRLPDPPRGE